MKQYDVKCPICGTMNKGIYLGETHGWMECEHCGIDTMNIEYAKKHAKRVPLLRLKQHDPYPAPAAV